MKPILTSIFCVTCFLATAQQTVFTVMQGPTRQGDAAFERGEYREAIELYRHAIDRDPENTGVLLKLAQSYSFTKDHARCVGTYQAVMAKNVPLSQADIFRYAEALSGMKNYKEAIVWYKKCLDADSDNELVAKKIWALSNVQFLLEDSSHYSIKPLQVVNTRASEMGAALYGDGLVFTSNRKGTRPVDMASSNATGPFYKLYIIEWKTDTITNERILARRPLKFARSLGADYNVGPVAFYDSRTKMVLVASSPKTGPGGGRALGLYFAELQDSKWKIVSSWQHNSENYSISDVTINSDGTTMYFSSNMKGGIGGKDIYMSTFSQGRWSKPANAGNVINTTRDEVAPYLHRNGTLYFSSNGLPGMGGLDIFKSAIKRNGFSDPENAGHPINSNGDDFGIIFDSLATRGYLSSNRANAGHDDDIYEFTMDLQTYPFNMSGVLRYKQHTWSDTLDIHAWPQIKVTLVDTWQDLNVQEETTAEDGSFSFTIPYFSRYHIVVTDERGHQHKASLELEKYRTEAYRYEIVVVKDLFAELNEQQK